MKIGMAAMSNPQLQYSNAFNINVIVRILSILHEHGRINRTNLAGKSGLNHGKCISYVKLLHLLEWAKITFDDGLFVMITEKGKEIIKKLTNIESL